MMYLTNKYYYLYFLNQRLIDQTEFEKLSSVYMLVDKIIKENISKNKDDTFSKSQLGKYWKEPMAWHQINLIK